MLYLPKTIWDKIESLHPNWLDTEQPFGGSGRRTLECVEKNFSGSARLFAWFSRNEVVCPDVDLPKLALALTNLGNIKLDDGLHQLTLEMVLAASDGISNVKKLLVDYGDFPRALLMTDRAAIVVAEKEGVNEHYVLPAKILHGCSILGVSDSDLFRAVEMGFDPLLRKLKVSEWTEIKKDLTNENSQDLPSLLMFHLFETKERVKAYMERSGKDLHDAGQFRLPGVDKLWSRKEWADFCLKATTAIDYLSLADVIENKIGRVPRTKQELDEVVVSIATESKDNNLKTTLLLNKVFLSDDEVTEYLQVMEDTPSNEKCFPDLGVLEEGEYVVKLLKAGDSQLLTAGLLTDCCQHLNGAGADCALKAWKEPTATILAIYKGARMVGQAYVWLSKSKDSVVIDSLETLGNANRKLIAELVYRFTNRFTENNSFMTVYVGENSYGASKDLIKLSKDKNAIKAPKPSFRMDYSDADMVVKLH